MFGCDAVFADGRIFGLVWKEGRIGLKMTESALYQQLYQLPEAAPWVAGDRIMSHWLLVPMSFHDDLDQLTFWAQQAYRQALAAGVSAPARKKK